MAPDVPINEARLTELETSAAVEALSTSEGDRDRIRGLLESLEVSHRTISSYGHCVDVVEGGPTLTDRAGQPLHGVFESSAVHHDGQNAIFFVAYLTGARSTSSNSRRQRSGRKTWGVRPSCASSLFAGLMVGTVDEFA